MDRLAHWTDVPASIGDETAARWGARSPCTNVHWSSNAIFRFDDAQGGAYLRIAHPCHRSLESEQVEVALVRHLAEAGVAVARPLATASGEHTLSLGDGLVATAWREVPGECLRLAVSWPHDDVFRAWGSSIARVHEESRSFVPPLPSWRDDWREEPLLADRAELLVDESKAVRAAADLAVKRVEAIEGPRVMTHADLGPQNFHLDARTGALHLFDFGNACVHHPASDLAIAVSTLGSLESTRVQRGVRQLLDGYAVTARSCVLSMSELAPFVRLRRVYALLSRLRFFAHPRTAAQTAEIDRMRRAVREDARARS